MELNDETQVLIYDVEIEALDNDSTDQYVGSTISDGGGDKCGGGARR